MKQLFKVNNKTKLNISRTKLTDEENKRDCSASTTVHGELNWCILPVPQSALHVTSLPVRPSRDVTTATAGLPVCLWRGNEPTVGKVIHISTAMKSNYEQTTHVNSLFKWALKQNLRKSCQINFQTVVWLCKTKINHPISDNKKGKLMLC